MSLFSEQLADDLRDIAGHEVGNFSAAMWATYRDALPTLALTMALEADERVRQLVADLAAMPVERRPERARELARRAPGRYGGRVVVELLLRAAEGRPFTGSASFGCYTDAAPGAGQAKKKPKGTHDAATHDTFRTAAECAVETVQLLTGDPVAVQPPESRVAHAQQLRSFMQEVAAYVLRRDERDRGGRPTPPSPSRRRRPQ